MKRRKAQSQIITTILIILLVLAMVIIVYQVVKGMVKKGTETTKERSACFGIELTLENIACVDGTLSGSVSRGADNVEALDMKIVVGSNVSAAIAAPNALGVTSIDITLDDYTATTGTIIKVAPVIGENICNPTDEFTVTCTTT